MKKRRILVIDDERSIRETLSEILTDEGYAVTAVESGEDGEWEEVDLVSMRGKARGRQKHQDRG